MPVPPELAEEPEPLKAELMPLVRILPRPLSMLMAMFWNATRKGSMIWPTISRPILTTYFSMAISTNDSCRLSIASLPVEAPVATFFRASMMLVATSLVSGSRFSKRASIRSRAASVLVR